MKYAVKYREASVTKGRNWDNVGDAVRFALTPDPYLYENAKEQMEVKVECLSNMLARLAEVLCQDGRADLVAQMLGEEFTVYPYLGVYQP